MKIITEDFLQNMDASFKNKSKKDIYMTYIMIFGIIFTFSYLLFWDSSEAAFTEKNMQINQLSSKITADEAYLEANPENKILNLDLEINKLDSALKIHKENNAYIKAKIGTISSLIYDEKIWGEYLHSISINANKYGVKIIDFTNEYANTDRAFGHILDINLTTTSNYKDTLKFINSLEQSELVVDVHRLAIKSNESLDTNLSISVWGITY
ncbi:MAG: hypothetical protein PHS42_01345 [Sulfurimonas sp.]|nr:hypothetical protein [Sulfurimonas sp.]MDD3834092.1 hypothetical protein [Sulfurimonas sp.]